MYDEFVSLLNINLATIYSLNNMRQMYVPSDFALESKILNCSYWILQRERREIQDAMKSI